MFSHEYFENVPYSLL